MVTVCSGSRPTDSRSFPVALKLTEQTPPAWKQRSTDSVCLVMASHTWIDGDVAKGKQTDILSQLLLILNYAFRYDFLFLKVLFYFIHCSLQILYSYLAAF